MGSAQEVPLPAEVHGAGESRGGALIKRVVSTLVLLPLFVAVVALGPVWLFGVLVVLVSGLGQWELTGMFARAGVRTYRALGLAGGVVVTASFALPMSERLALTGVLLAVLAASLRGQPGTRVQWEPAAVTVFGLCYVNWLLGYGFWLRDLESGSEWVLLLVWVTWLGETAAYVVGSAVGRLKLAPRLSPNKTVEGALAQLVVSVLAALAARAWFFGALAVAEAVTVGVLLGVVGQVGDLVESALKRSAGTKDTGHLIPGHGGILDRVDSLLFNAPVLYYYVAYVRTIGA
jgi:phosphatidate cytidylyltransferase